MPSLTEWKVPFAFQPRPSDYSFDLDRALSAVVGLHAIVPPDAFSAETLGTERAGNGVVIDDGLILTIGYLITEAESVWLHLNDGRVVEGSSAVAVTGRLVSVNKASSPSSVPTPTLMLLVASPPRGDSRNEPSCTT